jgi:hypothetical protein
MLFHYIGVHEGNELQNNSKFLYFIENDFLMRSIRIYKDRDEFIRVKKYL